MDQSQENIQPSHEIEENEAAPVEVAEGSPEHNSEEYEDSGTGSEEETTTEEESVEEEEPKLKYKRLDASELLKKDSASAMSVSDRIVVRISRILKTI